MKLPISKQHKSFFPFFMFIISLLDSEKAGSLSNSPIPPVGKLVQVGL